MLEIFTLIKWGFLFQENYLVPCLITKLFSGALQDLYPDFFLKGGVIYFLPKLLQFIFCTIHVLFGYGFWNYYIVFSDFLFLREFRIRHDLLLLRKTFKHTSVTLLRTSLAGWELIFSLFWNSGITSMIFYLSLLSALWLHTRGLFYLFLVLTCQLSGICFLF